MKKKISFSSIVSLLCILIFGVLLGIGFIAFGVKEKMDLKYCEQTVASYVGTSSTVKKRKGGNDGSATYYFTHNYIYVVNGEEYSYSRESSSRTPIKEIDILYRIDNPKEIMHDNSTLFLTFGTIWTLVYLLIFLHYAFPNWKFSKVIDSISDKVPSELIGEIIFFFLGFLILGYLTFKMSYILIYYEETPAIHYYSDEKRLAGSKSNYYIHHYYYIVDGEEFEYERDNSESVENRDAIKIMYNRNNPSEVEANSKLFYIIFSIIIGLLLALWIKISFLVINNYSKK